MGLEWFTPHVAADDKFVEPDYSLAQFFYSAATARELVDRLDGYRNPCCLCTPRLAWEWMQRGRTVRLLDLDPRFAFIPGYRAFDIFRPTVHAEAFDAVVFDPLFANPRLLRPALDAVSGGPTAPSRVALFMTFPVDRQAELLHEFAEWSLRRLSYSLHYNNVRPEFASVFGLYGNRELPLPAGRPAVAAPGA